MENESIFDGLIEMLEKHIPLIQFQQETFVRDFQICDTDSEQYFLTN